MHVRHLFLYTCLSLTAVAIAQDETAEHDATPYTLVWADEFDTPGRPDPNRWTYERGFVRNEEYQWYQPENASCDKGFLIIEGRRERVENPSYDEQSRNWKRNRSHAEYTSSSLMTRGLHSWTYGRFEMRARFARRRVSGRSSGPWVLPEPGPAAARSTSWNTTEVICWPMPAGPARDVGLPSGTAKRNQ